MSRLTFVYARPLFALKAIVGLLLLLACTSVATLLLARGAARQREMTVRVALGAGRLRLVRQVLTESLVLAAAGSLLGIVFAYFGADALMGIVTSGRMPGMASHIEVHPQVDLRVLLFTIGVSLATGILFGLAPALSAWHRPRRRRCARPGPRPRHRRDGCSARASSSLRRRYRSCYWPPRDCSCATCTPCETSASASSANRCCW